MHLLKIASALAVGLAANPASAQDIDQRPSIIVAGHGEVETEPDLATVNYTLRGEGSTSDDALRAMVGMGRKIETALRGIDPAAEPRTGDVSTQAVKSDDCKERDYGAKQLSAGPCAVLGYVATQIITVETRKVADAGTMVGLASRGGADDASISSFSLRSVENARTAAMTAALRDAAVKAAAVAAASRTPLGAILTISTTGREVITIRSEELLNSLPQSFAAAAPPPVAVNLKAKKITTAADVTVRYAIAR